MPVPIMTFRKMFDKGICNFYIQCYGFIVNSDRLFWCTNTFVFDSRKKFKDFFIILLKIITSYKFIKRSMFLSNYRFL